MNRAGSRTPGSASGQDVWIPSGAVKLAAILGLPAHPRGVVLFAHGSGSGRHSPRNNAVARVLQAAGLVTLLADLLTESEAEDRRKVFDIALLAERLLGCFRWIGDQEATQSLPAGFFGASTGAAAALVAAAEGGEAVQAVVSRGGRPDLAGAHLSRVLAPTQLIVGANDEPVIEMNREALDLLRCEKDLVIVPGASHLFEEQGTLEEVSRLARDWFLEHLTQV